MERIPIDARPRPPAWAGIYHQLCPRCRMGTVFRTSIFRIFPRRNERRPHCALKFEREQGYILGAMYLSHRIATAAILLLTVLVGAVLRWDLPESVGAGFLLFLPAASVVTFFSRVL